MKARRLFLTLLLLAAAAACNTPPVPAVPAPAAAQTAAPVPPVVAPVAPVAAAPAATPAKPVLATADGERSGSRVEIRELKRSSNDTIMLKLELYNAPSGEFLLSGYYLGDSKIHTDANGVGGIHLVDSANKKKYFVVRDTEEVCQCSRGLKDLEPGQSVSVWARFPAPPADVKAISVVVPHFSPMDDVPVS